MSAAADASPGLFRIGSDDHKELFCRSFLGTHRPFDPAEIEWPQLSEEEIRRLKALPVWSEAARTEAETALKVQTLGRAERDPLMAQAIALQGYEEGRHAELLRRLTERYGIAVTPFRVGPPPDEPQWTFLSVGYGECIDSFFAFGLFEIGRRSRLFPEALISIFETVVQEEARHILFLVNWSAYLRRRSPAFARPAYDVRRAWIVAAQILEHARHAMSFGKGQSEEGFEMTSHGELGDLSARDFLELCLSENARRLAPYDPRLLRPRLVPGAVRAALRLMPSGRKRPLPGSER
jgi:hypothetical protein